MQVSDFRALHDTLRFDELRIVDILLGAKERCVRAQTLYNALYDNRASGDLPVDSIIHVYLSRIRKAIRKTEAPIRIETQYAGYRAVVLREPVPAIDLDALDPC
jgi:DNA-binding response OmpR family regulator